MQELLTLVWQIRRWRPDVLVYLNASRGIAAARRDAMFFRLSGIHNMIGVPLTEEMQQHAVNPADRTREHEAQRLARNVSALGDANLDDPASWSLHLMDSERRRADEALEELSGRPFFAISLGTKVQSNEWGRDRWRGLLARLADAFPSHALVISGATVDREVSEYVAEGWRERAVVKLGGPCN